MKSPHFFLAVLLVGLAAWADGRVTPCGQPHRVDFDGDFETPVVSKYDGPLTLPSSKGWEVKGRELPQIMPTGYESKQGLYFPRHTGMTRDIDIEGFQLLKFSFVYGGFGDDAQLRMKLSATGRPEEAMQETIKTTSRTPWTKFEGYFGLLNDYGGIRVEFESISGTSSYGGVVIDKLDIKLLKVNVAPDMLDHETSVNDKDLIIVTTALDHEAPPLSTFKFFSFFNNLNCVPGSQKVIKGPKTSRMSCDSSSAEFRLVEELRCDSGFEVEYAVKPRATGKATINAGASFELNKDPHGTPEVRSIFTVTEEPQHMPTQCQPQVLDNGDFEIRRVFGKLEYEWDAPHYRGWRTTAANDKIAVWRSGNHGVQAASGAFFGVVQKRDALYQEINSPKSGVYAWALHTRAIESGSKVAIEVSDGKKNTRLRDIGGDESWSTHSGTFTVPPGSQVKRFDVVSLNGKSVVDDVKLWPLGVSMHVEYKTTENEENILYVGDRVDVVITLKLDGPAASNVKVSMSLPEGVDCVADSIQIVEDGSLKKDGACVGGMLRFHPMNLSCGSETRVMKFAVKPLQAGAFEIQPKVTFMNTLAGQVRVEGNKGSFTVQQTTTTTGPTGDVFMPCPNGNCTESFVADVHVDYGFLGQKLKINRVVLSPREA